MAFYYCTVDILYLYFFTAKIILFLIVQRKFYKETKGYFQR